MHGHGPRLQWLAVVTVAVLAGCASAPPSNSLVRRGYPLPADPPRAFMTSPMTVGVPGQAVVLYVQVQPGDRIELLGAEPVGTLDGAQARILVSRPVHEANGDQVIGKAFEPLEGAVLTAVSPSPGPDNDIGIVVQLTADRPGRFKVDNLRLRYRLNDGPEQVGEGIDSRWTVCADVVAPPDCPDEPPA